MKKTDAGTINWFIYDQDFVEWLFSLYETVEQMPSKREIGLMAAAFFRGKKQGCIEGYAKAREDFW